MKKIYLISSITPEGEKYYKIGYTKRKIEDRIKELETGSFSDIELVDFYEAIDYGITIENSLHKKFQFKKVNREWFDLSDDDVMRFKEYCQNYYDMFKIVNENNTYIQENKKRRFK